MSRFEAPPEASGRSAGDYWDEDAQRYDAANARTQRELTTAALRLAAATAGPTAAPGPRRWLPRGSVVADIGCGSGLSGLALGATGLAWVGVDVSAGMLGVCTTAGGGAGAVALADIGQGLPLRAGCADGAVSISAVQWLLQPPGGAARTARFFFALRAALRPPQPRRASAAAAGVLQAYLSTAGALHCRACSPAQSVRWLGCTPARRGPFGCHAQTWFGMPANQRVATRKHVPQRRRPRSRRPRAARVSTRPSSLTGPTTPRRASISFSCSSRELGLQFSSSSNSSSNSSSSTSTTRSSGSSTSTRSSGSGSRLELRQRQQRGAALDPAASTSAPT